MAVAAVPQSLVDELRSVFLKEVESQELNSVHPKDYERVKTDDHWLRRFLAHCENSIPLTTKMMWTSLKWRKEQQVNDIKESNIKMDIIIKGAFFPYGEDIDGNTLLIFKCKLHSKGGVNVDELRRCIIYWFERTERMTKGEPVSLFFDMDGCGLSNMDLDLIKYLIGLFKDYYPFFLNYIIIFEMPWILNAAFKIVKSWLPEKALEKLKMVGKKDLSNYVPKNQAFTSWGGESTYVFRFISEELQKTDQMLPVETGTGATNIRKVHFVDGSPMSEQQPAAPSEPKDDGPLAVTPSNIITFLREGAELVSTLELHNTDPTTQIAFKLKTTSPEKFRVKPSTGCLKPGSKETVTVALLPGFQLGGLSKDKFLVMSSVLDEKEAQYLDLSELWKAPGTRKVFQTRLRCVQSGEVTRNGNVVVNHGAHSVNNGDSQLIQLSNSIAQIRDSQHCFDRSLRKLLYIQIGQFLLILVLGFSLFYVLNQGLSGIPSENQYCAKPDSPRP
ncbi:motile sperm domain-containing protein 2-like isoform X2 [Euwallacea similis]|uniref:motile sperm domain-containing protein 2-like isoform X2 n=1 Tax=Euwallacea similis TaxID=1736056 RepID=UPI003450D53D